MTKKKKRISIHLPCSDHLQRENSPFGGDDLAKSVHHSIVVFTRSSTGDGFALQLHTCLDHIERVEAEEFGDSCDGTCGELRVEWQRLGL